MENMFKLKKNLWQQERETGRKKYNSADNNSMKKKREKRGELLFFKETFFSGFWTSGIMMLFLCYRADRKYKGYICADSLTCF